MSPPLLLLYFGDAILPEALVSSVVGVLPFRVTSVYTALLYAVMVTYVPFSLGMAYKMSVTAPNNVHPRKQNEALKATHPTFARIMAAEANANESFPFFAAAVLAATQAGVASATVCIYAEFWLMARLAFALVYAVGNNMPVSLLRSALFSAGLLVVGKLFALAAAQ